MREPVAPTARGQLGVEATDAGEQLLVEPAVGRQQVAQEGHQADDEAQDYRAHADLEALDVTRDVGLEDVEVQEAPAEDEAQDQQERGHEAEGLDGPVHAVGAKDHRAVAAQVLGDRGEEPRLSRLRVGLDLDVLDHQPGLARLDHGLERVGEVVVDEQGRDGLAVHRSEARGRVGDLRARGAANQRRAPALQDPLDPREVRDRVGLAIADADVGAPGQHGLDEAGDVDAAVLVVGVGVDDQIGAQAQAGVEPGHVRRREPAVAREADDVVDAELRRDLAGPVAAAVVDHQDLDLVDTGDHAGQIGEGLGQVLALVEAGDLDDELDLCCASRGRPKLARRGLRLGRRRARLARLTALARLVHGARSLR